MRNRNLALLVSVFLLVLVASLTAQELVPIVIVFDTSGSMKDVESEVKAALSEFIRGLETGSRVILVRFDVFSEIVASEILESDAVKESLIGQLQDLKFQGQKTNFDEAIKGAEAGLFRAGVAGDATVVVFSDGISDPSAGKPMINLISLAKQIFPQSGGYSIYLVGVTPDAPASGNCTVDENIVTMEVTPSGVQKVLQHIQEQTRRNSEVGESKSEAIEQNPEEASQQEDTEKKIEQKVEEGTEQESEKDDDDKVTVEVEPVSTWARVRNWLPYIIGFFAFMVLGLVSAIWILPHLSRSVRGARGSRVVAVQVYGRDETSREFWMQEGESVQIGPGICAYPVNTRSSANLRMMDRKLYVSPEGESNDISVNGEKITTWTPLASGDNVVIDGYLRLAVTF